MLDLIEDIARWWRLNVTLHADRLGAVVHGGLILGAAVLFGILGFHPQGRELFRLLLEEDAPNAVEIICAVGAAGLLSGLLFVAYRSFLPSLAEDTQHGSPLVRGAALLGLFTVTTAPWLTCIVSIWGMWRDVAGNHGELQRLIDDTNADPIRESGAAALHLMGNLESRAPLAMLAILALMLVTLYLVTRSSRYALVKAVRFVFVAAAVVVFVGVAVLPAVTGWLMVDFFRAIGPLAASFLAVGCVILLGLVIGWFARFSGFAPSIALAIVLMFYWAGAATSDLIASAAPGDGGLAAGEDFKQHVAKAPGAKTPPAEIVVSAQGGGMYAAIASSLIMARLNADGTFLPSVLAVSSVSGGSLGIALHNALSSPGGCGTASAGGGSQADIEAGLRRSLLQPHLAPVLGNIPADLLRKSIPLMFFSTTDRAEAFKQSLVQACPALGNDLSELAKDRTGRPALVFNTTWMSNGHRVAFAPYSFQNTVGDGTLWSFSDVYPGAAPYRYGRRFAPSIIDAAVTSARYPGILPPLSLNFGRGRHHYGDGAYADGSGVVTALDMLDAAKAAGARPRLMMISFDYKPVAPQEEAGTRFDETLGPLHAILGVRDNLAKQAITRAERSISPSERVRFSLDPDRMGLALGLQLSRTSYEVLSVLVGKAEWCPDPLYRNADIEREDNTILRNSCIARRVRESWRR